MAKRLKLTENYVAQCAHGGKVVPKGTSSTTGVVCAGVPIVNIQDLPGTPIKGCPKKSPCTKVANFTTASAEMNIKSTSVNPAVDFVGIVSNKGAAVSLSFHGQSIAGSDKKPSFENAVVEEDEPLEEVIREEKKNQYKEKYALYFLRKSEEFFKPLRPTREFIKTDEAYSSKDGLLEIKDDIHVHTFAYVYINQENIVKEYKVISKGTRYAENIKEIFFKNTKTNIEYNYIPIEKDTKIDISYSNIKLIDNDDIKKLKRLTLNPKEPDTKNSFYFKDSNGIPTNEIIKEDLEIQKKFKQDKNGKQKRLNILCIIDDILGEIEDMYVRYYTNYKLALAHNDPIIEDVKKRNQYTYTIANMVDYFYLSKEERKIYNDSMQELKNIYNDMLFCFLSENDLINILVKDKDISKILDKDINNVAKSFFQQIQFLKKDFFEYIHNKDKTYCSKTNFRTINDYGYLPNLSKNSNHQETIERLKKNGIKFLEFNTSNDDYTQVKNNASHALAHVIFSLLYSEEFESELKSTNIYLKLNELRNKFLIKLRAIAPKPNISDNAIKDMQEVVEKQTVYHDMMVKSIIIRDKFLEEYENLDYVKKIKSFEQKGEKVSFKSKYIYSKEENYYKEEEERPVDIIKKIKVKLKDEKLKKLLKIYENVENTNKLDYVVSAMNIIYLLSAPRTHLDEESDINSFFNEELNHIYMFVVDMTKKRIALSDKEKDTLNMEYQVSNVYSKMQMALILNDIIFSNSKKKALKFIEEFKVRVETDEKDRQTNINYKYIHDHAQNIKSLQREYYETFKNIEGITSEFEKMLKEFTKGETKRVSISKPLANYLSVGLRTYSSLIAIAKISDYLFFDDSKKNIKSHIGFVKDLTDVTLSLGLLISKYPNTPMKVLEVILKDTLSKTVSQSSKKLLTVLNTKVASKVAIVAVIIITAYDVVNLYKREDYDALSLTLVISSINLALLLSVPILPAVVVGAIISIIGGLILNEILDSDLDKYLEKSLLYKTLNTVELSFPTITSIFTNKKNSEVSKMYQAPYLFEITNKKEELKTISNDGFNNPKKLVNFIGENYKGNEQYFDTSLKNELSFFKSSLFGYKLEKTEFKSQQRVRTISGYEISFYVQKALKIPNILVTDKNFKLYFSAYGDEYLEFDANNLTKENGYYIFNFFPENNPYINLNQFTNKIKKQNHKAYIVVLSSQIELKYEVEFRDNDKITPNCYIDIASLEQVSFTVEDEELIKGKE